MIDQTIILTGLQEMYLKRVKNPVKEPLAPDTKLSSLGIDSLSYSMLIADIEEVFGVTLYGPDILKLKTIADIIAFVEQSHT